MSKKADEQSAEQKKPARRKYVQFTPDRGQRIIGAISAGVTHEVAAQAVGINQVTLVRWIKRSKRADASPEMRKFGEELKAAEASAELRWITRINEASKNYWQAAAWLLERKYPEKWGKRENFVTNVNSTVILPQNPTLREDIFKNKAVQDGISAILNVIQKSDEKINALPSAAAEDEKADGG